jgi:hypothetical protein
VGKGGGGNETLCQKYPNTKRAVGVAPAIECLPSKPEAPSSNLSTSTTTKKESYRNKIFMKSKTYILPNTVLQRKDTSL